MEKKWSIREYRDGDEKDILELYKAVYPEKEYDQEDWLKWWKWMFRDNPAGASWIWLAEHNGKIVGQYPLILMNLKIGKEIMRVSQNIDVMTHPDYQHQGIFSALERLSLQSAGREGVHITIGFPNEAAYPGHIKSGWFHICSLRMPVRLLNWENALRMRLRNGFLLKLAVLGGNLLFQVLYREKKPPVMKDLTISQVPFFDDRIDEFWVQESKKYPLMVVRNREYLNWRYVAVKGAEYSISLAEKSGDICGYLVLGCRQRQYTKLGVIFDILAESEKVAQCLVAKAMEHFRQQNVDLVYCTVLGNKALTRALRRNGLGTMPFIKGSKFGAYCSSTNVSTGFLGDYRNWYVQLGDSDAL